MVVCSSLPSSSLVFPVDNPCQARSSKFERGEGEVVYRGRGAGPTYPTYPTCLLTLCSLQMSDTAAKSAGFSIASDLQATIIPKRW